MRRLEALTVDRHRALQFRRREMRGEGVGQAQRRRKLRPVKAGAEYPDRHVEARARHRLDPLPLLKRFEITEELDHVLRKGVDVGVQVAAQRPGRRHVGPRSATDAEIDAAGMECRQRAESFRDHERCVVRQHDATGADADRRRPRRDMGNRDRRRRAGDAGHVVMFGEPIAPVAPSLGMPGEIERVPQRLRRVGTFGNGGKVED